MTVTRTRTPRAPRLCALSRPPIALRHSHRAPGWRLTANVTIFPCPASSPAAGADVESERAILATVEGAVTGCVTCSEVGPVHRSDVAHINFLQRGMWSDEV